MDCARLLEFRAQNTGAGRVRKAKQPQPPLSRIFRKQRIYRVVCFSLVVVVVLHLTLTTGMKLSRNVEFKKMFFFSSHVVLLRFTRFYTYCNVYLGSWLNSWNQNADQSVCLYISLSLIHRDNLWLFQSSAISAPQYKHIFMILFVLQIRKHNCWLFR